MTARVWTWEKMDRGDGVSAAGANEPMGETIWILRRDGEPVGHLLHSEEDANWIVAALNEKEQREDYGVLGVVQARTDFGEQVSPVATEYVKGAFARQRERRGGGGESCCREDDVNSSRNREVWG